MFFPEPRRADSRSHFSFFLFNKVTPPQGGGPTPLFLRSHCLQVGQRSLGVHTQPPGARPSYKALDCWQQVTLASEDRDDAHELPRHPGSDQAGKRGMRKAFLGEGEGGAAHKEEGAFCSKCGGMAMPRQEPAFRSRSTGGFGPIARAERLLYPTPPV